MPEVPHQLGCRAAPGSDEGDEALVSRRLDDDADRAEAVAECGDALEEWRHAVEARERQLDGESETVRHTVSAQRLN